MPDSETNADIIRNRLASFATAPRTSVTCPQCGSTLAPGKEFCQFCGAPSSQSEEEFRVATASPELTAQQKAYDPYAHLIPPHAVPVSDDLTDEEEDALEADESAAPAETHGEDVQEDATRDYRRVVMIGLVVGVLGIVAAAAWYWRGSIRELASSVNHQISAELAAFNGTTAQPAPQRASPQADSRTGLRPPARQARPASLPVRDTVQKQPEVRPSESGGLLLASTSNSYGDSVRPAVVNATVSPMRVTITPRESLQLLMYSVPPVYPAQARERRLEGSVALKAVIGKEGSVLGLQVVSGDALLVPAAMEAVRQWRYRPYLLYGEPREVETTIIVDFSLARERAGR